jgi:hypothetical protein
MLIIGLGMPKKNTIKMAYVEGLKGRDLERQIKSIREGTDRPKDVKFKSKRSTWCQQFEDKHGTTIADAGFIDKNLLRKEGQERIINKGKAAYYTSGSRPKQTPYSWGKARLCSVLMGGPARKIDKNIYDKYKVGGGVGEKNPTIAFVKQINKAKRFRATFSDETTVDFGQTNPSKGTFIDHKDTSLKKNYVARHKQDLKTNDPKRAGYLSMFLLWNKPTLDSSIKDYNRRVRADDWSLP